MGRPICNLRFADDIDLMAGSNTELQDLTNKLADSAASYGMEISTGKSKILVNSVKDATGNITMSGDQLEEVNEFKYLGATLSKDGTSDKEIRIRITAATSAMARLSKIWRSNISFAVKYKLYKSLVVSIFLYDCEAWALKADLERRIEAFQFKCFRRLLGISYREHKTNEFVWNTVLSHVGPQEPLLATVRRRKLQWFAHVTRHNTLCKTILQGTVEGGRRRGRQRMSWSDNVKNWTDMTTPELLEAATDRPAWRRMSSASALMPPPDDSTSHGSE